MKTIEKRDDKGRVIYYKNEYSESWREYNDQDKIIHYKSDRYEFWKEYDNNGNMIRYRDNFGQVIIKEYDSTTPTEKLL
jgi:hypothetical protein